VNIDLVIALILCALLVLEHFRRSGLARVAAIAGAIGVIFLAQPVVGPAYRRALETTDRVTHRGSPSDRRQIPEYASGVLTMGRIVEDDLYQDNRLRWFGTGVLVWLAMSPLLRRNRSKERSDQESPKAAGVRGGSGGPVA
jgi:hypothetical protein